MWTRLWIGLSIATCASMMMGCAASMPPSKGRAPLDVSLLTPCPPLLPLDDGTGASLLRKLIEVSEMYYDCALSKDKLGEAVK